MRAFNWSKASKGSPARRRCRLLRWRRTARASCRRNSPRSNRFGDFEAKRFLDCAVAADLGLIAELRHQTRGCFLRVPDHAVELLVDLALHVPPLVLELPPLVEDAGELLVDPLQPDQ